MQGYGEFGFMNLGRAAAFFIDPNWLCNWITILYLIYFLLVKNKIINSKKFKTVTCLLIAILLLTQSRVGFLSVILGALVINYGDRSLGKKIFYSIIALFILYVFFYFLLPYLPFNIYYDLVDLERNPRLHDFYIVSENMENKEWFGHGLGTIGQLNDSYNYLEWSNAINVLPVQIYYEFGIFGLVILLLNILLIIKYLYSNSLRIVFLFLLFYTIFHNPTYKQYYWVLLSIIVYIDIKFFNKINFIKSK
ncbi:O-antigen ligase family protein [Apibacter sp. HY039]|uniref:O-antigen ligase family protein n=1 Tax=Apibacter sp. HY039 TaxID=2501476 RepID=UPI000FEB633A|nr:O-antigen ligase family protein [Apibacter sp. HY039]